MEKNEDVKASKWSEEYRTIKPLTKKELDVLVGMVEGMNNPEIAEHLGINIHTAKSRVSIVIRKLNVNDRVQAVVKALRLGLAE